MSPWPWKSADEKKCAICGKRIEETEEPIKFVYEEHPKKKYFCSDSCWRKRGLLFGSKLGSGCKFYDEKYRMCIPKYSGIEGDDHEMQPCSLKRGTYMSCNVYPVLENRRRNYVTKLKDASCIETCSSCIQASARINLDDLALLSTIERNLAEIVDINTRDEKGYTLLYWAAKMEYPLLVKLLLTKGADVNAQSQDYTVLEVAIVGVGSGLVPDKFTKRKRREVIKLLLSHGAKVNTQNRFNKTPIHLATEYCYDAEIVKMLIDQGAEVNPKLNPDAGNDIFTLASANPLINSVRSGDIDMVRVLLEAGADVNMPLSLDGITPLHTAVSKGYADIIKLLLDWGADISAKNFQGKTAIQYVQSDDILKIFKDRNPNQKSE